MTQSNQFDPQAWVFGNQPSTTQTQSNSEQPAFDPQAWVFRNNADKDVTGLGSRYAENFNAQLSDRQANQGQRLNPVWKMQEYENFSKAMVEHYANQGYTPEQINTIQAEFAKLADPRKQNKWYEPFTDLGRSFAAGYSNIASSAVGAFAPESALYNELKDTANAWRGSLSDKGQINAHIAEQNYQKDVASGENETIATLKMLINNPLVTANMAMETAIPQILLAYGTGGLGLGAINAVSSAGNYREEIKDAWENLPKETALQKPQIQQRMARGMTFEEALRDVSTDFSDNWGGISRAAAIGGIDTISPLGKLGQGVNTGVRRTFMKEVGKEYLQEGVEQANSNYGVGAIDGKTQLMDNVQRSSATGAVLGVPTGAISAYDAYRNDRNKLSNESEQTGQNQSDDIVQNTVDFGDVDTNDGQSSTTFDEKALETVLQDIDDEGLRDEYFNELRSDINDGLITERAKENTAYGRLAQSYLNATNQQPSESELSSEQVDKFKAAELRDRMDQWKSDGKATDINDLLGGNPMTFADEQAKLDFANNAAFSQIQELAKRNGIDPLDGNAIREWLSDIGNVEVTVTPETDEQSHPEITQPTTVQKGATTQIQLGSQGTQNADYELIEANELNVNLKPNLYQNRDRTSADSQMQINNYARNLNPAYLGASVDVTQGAPTVDSQYGVFAGNGRLSAIQKAYETNPDKAADYKNYLIQNATQFGFSQDQVNAMQQPVLVRKVNSNIDITKAVEEGNFNTGLDKGVLGDATSNAKYITNDLLNDVQINDDGTLNLSESNTPFIQGLVSKIPVEHRPKFFAERKLGNQSAYTLTAQGKELVENALLVKAFSDPNNPDYSNNLLTDLIVSTDESNKRVQKALVSIAGKVIQTKGNSDYDISNDITQAYALMRQGKQDGKTAEQVIAQQDFINPPSKRVQALTRLFYSPKSVKDIQEPLNRYLESVVNSNLNQTDQNSMFVDELNVSSDELMRDAGLRYRLNEDGNSAFAKAVDRASRGYKGSNKRFVKMGTTPDVLKMVGLPDTTVSMREDVFYKVLSGGKHFLTVNDLKRLPEQINNPIAITRSRTRDNGYLVFTELTEHVDGIDKPVIAALHVKEKDDGLEVIDVASSYGRYVSQINEDLKQTLYWNKTKGYPFANRAELQLPNVILSEDNLSKSNIKTEADLSQYQSLQSNQKNAETDTEIQQARQILQKVLVEHADKVELVRSSDLNLAEGDPKLTAEGYFENGKVVILVDNIQGDNIFSREERLAWVAWHELGHNGVKVRLGYIYKNLMQHARTNAVVSVIGRKIQQQYQSDGVTISQDVATEEAIVELYAAAKTGNWDKLEQDYGVKVHHSWKTGDKTIGSFLEKVVERLRRIIGLVMGKDLSKATSEDILAILKQVEQGVNSSQEPTANNGNDTASAGLRYRLNEDGNSAFAKAVDDVANGNAVNRYVQVGTTPNVLKMLGLPDVRVTISGQVLHKVMQGKHNVTAETLKQLPKQINNPVAVMRSATQDNSYVVLTELIESDNGKNKPVIAALHLKKSSHGLELISIASVYGRSNSQIQRGLDNDLLYWNKTKGSQFLTAFGLQLPSHMQPNTNLSANNVKTEIDLSQYQSDNADGDLSETAYNQAKAEGKTELIFQQWKQVRSPEFKRWFGDWENDPANASKVINPKTGEPLVVYHYTEEQFNTFDVGRARQYSDIPALFFTTNPEMGMEYGSNEMAVFLNIRNPTEKPNISTNKDGKALREELVAQGYDGTLVDDSYDDYLSIEYAAFNPNQIKSATDNNGNFDPNEEDIRYSIKQSVDNLAKTGKAEREAKQLSKLRTFNGFKSLVKEAGGWLDERIADGLRPVNDWIDNTLKNVIPNHEAERLKDDMYRAKGVRDSLNTELEQKYLKPLLQKLSSISRDKGPSGKKLDEISVKRLVGYWISTRYSIEKNTALLEAEHKAMLEAKAELEKAKELGEQAGIEEADTIYRKAERQYRYRKSDVENTNFTDKNFKVGTAGGWSIPEAKQIMANIEKHISRKDLESAAEIIYDLNQARLEIDFTSGRYTQEQYNEYKDNRHYVPLTGDPNVDDDVDFIAGVGQNSVNISKDKSLKGRKTSEAEDAIDAVWKAVGKSNTYAGWADFKQTINEIYESEFHRLQNEGLSAKSAKEQVEETLGISKQKMQGLTRSSDNVLLRKEGNVYYEYKLPSDVINALKNDNVEQANSFLKVLSKPTSWYARGVTQWTLTFAPMNMMRDTWEKSEFIRVQKLYDKNGRLLDDKTMDKIGRAVLKNAFLDKSVWAATKRLGFHQELRNSGSEALLKQLLKDGGVSTYSTYLAKTETDLIKKLKEENNPLAKKLEQAGAVLEGYNKIFDNVSALAAYKAFIDHGVDPKQAAAKTLELTNFRKTGSKMRGIKALYMFSQPTAMGARNLIKYLSTPKGQKRFIGYMAVMMPLYLTLRAMDDEDEGGNVMDQLGDITRYIPIPMGNGKYLKIPVGFGMPQMAWNFSVNVVKAGAKDLSVSEAGVNMLSHSLKTFAPVSPSEISAAKYPLEKLTLTATPTILQPLMQNVLNRSAFGSHITTNFVREDKLKAEQSKSTTADFWEDVAIELNDNLGIDMHPEQIKNLFDGYGSMFGSLKELQTIFVENPNREQLGRRTRTPFLNQFIGTTNEFAAQDRYYEASNEAQTLFKEYESRKARGKLEGWLTADKKSVIQFHQINKKRMGELRSEKAQLTRALRQGKMNPNVYKVKLKAYNQKVDKLQRVLLKRWREIQGLNTN